VGRKDVEMEAGEEEVIGLVSGMRGIVLVRFCCNSMLRPFIPPPL
jgi:hypothetical protein